MSDKTTERIRILAKMGELSPTYDLYTEHRRKSFCDIEWINDKEIIKKNLSTELSKGNSDTLELLWDIRDHEHRDFYRPCENFGHLENKWCKNNKLLIVFEMSPAYVHPKYLKAVVYESKHEYYTMSFYRETKGFLQILARGMDLVYSSEITSMNEFVDYLKKENYIEGFDFSYANTMKYALQDLMLYVPISNGSYIGINPGSNKPSYNRPMLKSQQLCALKIGPNDKENLIFFGMSFNYSISRRCLDQIYKYSDLLLYTEILGILPPKLNPQWFTFTVKKPKYKRLNFITFTYQSIDQKIIVEVTGEEKFGDKVDQVIHLPTAGNKRRFQNLFWSVLDHLKQKQDQSYKDGKFQTTDWIFSLIKDWKKAVFIKDGNRITIDRDPILFLRKTL
jgi:hypothetical protein